MTTWAWLNGIHPQTAYRWFRTGTLTVPARRVRTILVDMAPAPGGRTAVGLDARVSSHDQRADLERQPGRLLSWAAERDMTEVLTSLCARLYGRRSARTRAARALRCAAAPVGPAT